jgi:gag-polyprotein putative aspartyl protease
VSRIENNNLRTTAVRTQTKIQNIEIPTIIDSGASDSVMSDKLRRKLGIPIIESSNIKFTLANGKSTPALGKSHIEVEFDDDIILPIKVNIVESTGEELLIGNDELLKRNAKIDYQNQKVTLKNKTKIVHIPMSCIKEESESEGESDEEYEKQDIREIFTSLGIEEDMEKEQVLATELERL